MGRLARVCCIRPELIQLGGRFVPPRRSGVPAAVRPLVVDHPNSPARLPACLPHRPPHGCNGGCAARPPGCGERSRRRCTPCCGRPRGDPAPGAGPAPAASPHARRTRAHVVAMTRTRAAHPARSRGVDQLPRTFTEALTAIRARDNSNSCHEPSHDPLAPAKTTAPPTELRRQSAKAERSRRRPASIRWSRSISSPATAR